MFNRLKDAGSRKAKGLSLNESYRPDSIFNKWAEAMLGAAELGHSEVSRPQHKTPIDGSVRKRSCCPLILIVKTLLCKGVVYIVSEVQQFFKKLKLDKASSYFHAHGLSEGSGVDYGTMIEKH